MAKWWEYPAWRRTVLQVTMWALLGATLGMAAMVSSYRSGSINAKYSAPIACGKYVVRVPLGWKIVLHPTGPVRVEAFEQKRVGGRPRRLQFYERQLTESVTAEDVLLEINAQPGSILREDDTSHLQDVRIAGMNGTMFVRGYTRMVAIISLVPVIEYSAAVVSPDGASLAVKLVCEGDPDDSDPALFGELIGRIKLAD